MKLPTVRLLLDDAARTGKMITAGGLIRGERKLQGLDRALPRGLSGESSLPVAKRTEEKSDHQFILTHLASLRTRR